MQGELNDIQVRRTQNLYISLPRYDSPSSDGLFPAYTDTHKDWGQTFTPVDYHRWGGEIFEKELSGGVTVARPRKKTVQDIEIKISPTGVPELPTEDPEKKWNLETQKLVIRNYIKAHYGEWKSHFDNSAVTYNMIYSPRHWKIQRSCPLAVPYKEWFRKARQLHRQSLFSRQH